MREPAHDAQVNVVGTVQVARGRAEARARAWSSPRPAGRSTASATARRRKDSPRLPLSPYGIAKLCGEEYLRGFNRIHGTSHVVARLGNVFGPRQSASLEGGVVAIFLDRFARGDGTVIFGDGLQTRDFVYVGDVVSALLAAAAHEGGGVFNVGSGTETDGARAPPGVRRGRGRRPPSPRFEPARLATCAAPRSTSRSRAAELGFARRDAARGRPRRHVGLGDSRE